ncbi:MAG: hypothetical protein FWE21_08465 [Defluviitaleaceae bacterium]|nr:hypothetical protein [Defluviitaleaceae bacterium]
MISIVAKRQRLADLLAALAVFVLVFNVLTISYIGFFNNPAIPWTYLFAAAPFLAFLYFRERVPNFSILISIYVFMFFMLFIILLPIGMALLFCGVGLIIGAILRVNGRALRLTQQAAYVFFAGFLVMFIASEAFLDQVPYLSRFVGVSALVCLLSIFLQVYLVNFDLALQKSRKTDTDAGQGVMALAKSTTSGFFGTVAVIGGILAVIPVGAMLFGLLSGWMSAFRSWLAGFSPYRHMGGQMMDVTITGTPTIFDVEDYGLFGEEGVLYMYYEPGTNAILYAVVVIFFLVVIPLGAFLLHFFTKGRDKAKQAKRRQGGVQDKAANRKFRFSDITDLLARDKGPKHPVRKAYIKKVRSHIKQGVAVKPHHATDVIATSIRPNENIDDLTKTYEQARYGQL